MVETQTSKAVVRKVGRMIWIPLAGWTEVSRGACCPEPSDSRERLSFAHDQVKCRLRANLTSVLFSSGVKPCWLISYVQFVPWESTRRAPLACCQNDFLSRFDDILVISASFFAGTMLHFAITPSRTRPTTYSGYEQTIDRRPPPDAPMFPGLKRSACRAP